MVYSDVPGERVRTEETPAELRNAVLDQRCRRAGTVASGAGHRAALLRPADGHRMGQGRPHRQALHRAGAPGDREVARARHPDRRFPAARGEVLSEGRASATRSAAAPRAWCAQGRHGTRAARRRADRRHDRPRLGAGDEAQRRHRHQPRRPHLPRGDHRPRAGRARGGRHRQRAGPHPRRQPGDRQCAEGDTGFIYAGALPFERTTTDLGKCRRRRSRS